MQNLTKRARVLRTNQTEAEKLLWKNIRNRQLNNKKFRRQHQIENYIVDFICMEQKLIIELDGGQHAEQQSYDEKRTEFLESEGNKVIRFWNNEVLTNIEGVLSVIGEAVS